MSQLISRNPETKTLIFEFKCLLYICAQNETIQKFHSIYDFVTGPHCAAAFDSLAWKLTVDIDTLLNNQNHDIILKCWIVIGI